MAWCHSLPSYVYAMALALLALCLKQNKTKQVSKYLGW